MAVRKYISLEEVRKNPKLLARFIKQHETEGDLKAFKSILNGMVRNRPQAAKTLGAASGASSSGTRTRRGSDEGT